jgi:hypothetical protein
VFANARKIICSRRRTAIVIVGTFAAALAFVSAKFLTRYNPATAFRVASGLVSHQICSSVFVSHLGPKETFERIAPTLGPLSRIATYNIDYQESKVRARIAGVAYSSAVYRRADLMA